MSLSRQEAETILRILHQQFTNNARQPHPRFDATVYPKTLKAYRKKFPGISTPAVRVIKLGNGSTIAMGRSSDITAQAALRVKNIQ